MTSRRVPLASVPNAANSPRRAMPAAAAGKRYRPNASEQREAPYGQPPPAKKQIVEVENVGIRATSHGVREHKTVQANTEVTNKATLARRAVSTTREVASSQQKSLDKQQKGGSENLETIRQWQRHYRRVFPQFVFYFESIPDETRQKSSRQIASLGAKEEQFFSKTVTHVVTTRSIPSELSSTSPGRETKTMSSSELSRTNNVQPKTINPSLLDKLEQPADLRSYLQQQRGLPKPDSQASRSLKASLLSAQEVEAKKIHNNASGILNKAREMGMKIWTLEKFQRIMTTMFESDTGEEPAQTHRIRASGTVIAASKTAQSADLSQLLKNEKVNGPADRDRAALTSDLVQFSGYYVYVHDMDEVSRPVMARDYKKPSNKEEGKWPQFRLTGPGRCPFIEDAAHMRKLQLQQDKLREAKIREQKAALPTKQANPPVLTRTRAAAAMQAARNQPQADELEKRTLTEIDSSISSRPSTATQASKPLEPPRVIPAKRTNPETVTPVLFGSAQANLRTMPRFAGGEPIASGVQPSNVTSAIRSQMISSTAAAPGAMTNSSREVHQLQRKVLERNSGPSLNSMPSSYMNDVRAAINADVPTTRAATRKAQETIMHIHEDGAEDEEQQQTKKPVGRKKRTPTIEREVKAGYCENCREKFDDFDEHVVTRKHRKFALSQDNWRELDELLNQLSRPERDR
ncbi:MAG: hypothetical protein M1820_001314 [Bogoriella megaspora]|nr:MAG: hypothetical protein M1820_001314 [Bogoriella megaspora]